MRRIGLAFVSALSLFAGPVAVEGQDATKRPLVGRQEHFRRISLRGRADRTRIATRGRAAEAEAGTIPQTLLLRADEIIQ
jgi:hypothetical protein